MPITTHETSPAGKQVKSCLMQIDCVVIKPELIHRQNKTRSGSDNRSDNTNINPNNYIDMETNLKVDVFENDLVVVRPNGTAVVVTNDSIISLEQRHITAIVNNLSVIQEYHNAINNRDLLINELKRELKVANEKVVDAETRLGDAMQELANREVVAEYKSKVAIKGYIARVYGSIVRNLDDEVICDCGQVWRAEAVVEALKNGQIDVETVKLVYPNKPVKSGRYKVSAD